MKLGKLLLGAALMVTSFVGAQDGVEKTECNRYKAIAGNAYAEKLYEKAAKNYIKAEQECGELDKAYYAPMIYSIKSYRKGLSDKAAKKAYADTVVYTYRNYEKAYGTDFKMKSEEGYMAIFSGLENKRMEADKAFEIGVHGLKEKGADKYIKAYYKNLYKLWTLTEGDTQANYKKRLITEYFKLSEYITAGKKSPKVLEELTGYLNNAVTDCNAILPEIASFLNALPQEKEAKKSMVNNFMSMLEKKNCTESKEYGSLIDTLISLDPNSIDAMLGKAKYQMAKGNTSAAIKTFKDAKSLTQDADQISDIELTIANAYYRKGSYKAAHDAGLAVTGKNRGEGGRIAANSVSKNANNCGESTFDRKANNYYAVQIAEKYGISSSSYKSKCPTSADVFNEGKSVGDKITLSCWGKKVSIKAY